jgi:hypothetical protein
MVYFQQVMQLTLANSIPVAMRGEVVSIPAIRISGHNARAGKRA